MYNETFIQELYSNSFIDTACKKAGSLFKTMVEHDKHLKSTIQIPSTKELNYIMEQLTEIITEEIYPRQEANHIHIGINTVNVEEDKEPSSKYSIENKTFRDLFIWTILMNYIDMAKVLLAHLNHRICAALIARKILKSYRDKYAVFDDTKTEYTRSMDYFEDYAIDCLTLCYKNNPNMACELVLRQSDMFGNVTCLEVSIHILNSFSPI